MLKLLTFLTVFCATTAYAGTNQIDIIGLVPDVSTQEQVESAKAEFGYVIGGFELICIPEFIDGKLSQLLCVTGEDSASRDRTTDSYRLASNSEIHKVLVSGFTKKIYNNLEQLKCLKANGYNTNYLTLLKKYPQKIKEIILGKFWNVFKG